MEELYESEVLWPESNEAGGVMTAACTAHSGWLSGKGSSSAPVDIPAAKRPPVREEAAVVARSWAGEVVVPPHVMASRGRMVGKAAFSVCSGQGRTLKGRDLRHVRDTVLRMTGFLET